MKTIELWRIFFVPFEGSCLRLSSQKITAQCVCECRVSRWFEAEEVSYGDAFFLYLLSEFVRLRYARTMQEKRLCDLLGTKYSVQRFSISAFSQIACFFLCLYRAYAYFCGECCRAFYNSRVKRPKAKSVNPPKKYPWVPKNVWSGLSGTRNPNMKLVLV